MFEIKDTTKEDVKRLIIYTENDGLEQSIGIKLDKKELYSLYIALRDVLKDADETLINNSELINKV